VDHADPAQVVGSSLVNGFHQRDHAPLLPKVTSSPAPYRLQISSPMPNDIYQGGGTSITAGFSDEVITATTRGLTLYIGASENPYLRAFQAPLPDSLATYG
jgi:hypothetical protein